MKQKLQTFQYKRIHNLITCTKKYYLTYISFTNTRWLHLLFVFKYLLQSDITIKYWGTCDVEILLDKKHINSFVGLTITSHCLHQSYMASRSLFTFEAAWCILFIICLNRLMPSANIKSSLKIFLQKSLM